jgi:hypothetical protein
MTLMHMRSVLSIALTAVMERQLFGRGSLQLIERPDPLS